MKISCTKYNYKIYLILLFVSTIITLNYILFVYPLFKELIFGEYQGIINQTALSPVRHRVLFSYTLHVLHTLVHSISNNQHSFALSFFLLCFASYMFTIVSSFKLFQIFHNNILSLFLSLLFSLSLIVAHYYHYANAYSMLEGGLFSAGFYFAFKQKKIHFFVITFIAILNRETGVFLAPAYLLVNNSLFDIITKPSVLFKKPIELIIPIFALFEYIMIRKITGETQHSITLSETFYLNTTPFNLFLSAVRYSLYFHVYLFLFIEWKNIPIFLKNQLPLAAIITIFIIFFGIWMEIRMFNGILPLILCVGGYSLHSIDAWTKPKP